MEILAKLYWGCIIQEMLNKKCLECKKEFTPTKGNLKKGGGKFCSMKCYHKQAISHRKGKESPFWKGKEAKYGAIHDYIKSLYGSAIKCENPDCVYPRKTKNGLLQKPMGFEWALRKGRKYEDRKKDSFIQLCVSCHQKYNFNEDKRKRNNKGIFIKK